jgi:signal transduction histidine kinase
MIKRSEPSFDLLEWIQELKKDALQPPFANSNGSAVTLSSEQFDKLLHHLEQTLEEKNPLNTILANSDVLLQRFEEMAEYRPFIDHIQTQVERLTVLVNDMLDLGKLAEHYNFARYLLPSILEESISNFRLGNPKQRISYSSPSGELLIWADPVRLQRVFINLIRNAAQHSPGNSAITTKVEPQYKQKKSKHRDHRSR